MTARVYGHSMTTTNDTHTAIPAEDAPIGVLLWSVRDPQYRPNYTLRSVVTIRDAYGETVTWMYENGQTRSFHAGEQVVIDTAATDGGR